MGSSHAETIAKAINNMAIAKQENALATVFAAAYAANVELGAPISKAIEAMEIFKRNM